MICGQLHGDAQPAGAPGGGLLVATDAEATGPGALESQQLGMV